VLPKACTSVQGEACDGWRWNASEKARLEETRLLVSSLRRQGGGGSAVGGRRRYGAVRGKQKKRVRCLE
jgi:hypothetical protein